jgi:hypothetical protein
MPRNSSIICLKRIEENQSEIWRIRIMNKITQKQEQEKLWKLVLEVRAKNGMTLSRMNHVLERLGKTGMIPQ